MFTNTKNTFTGLSIVFWTVIMGKAFAAGNSIDLLEPIGGQKSISTTGKGLGVIGEYFGLLYPWLVGTAAGVVILWGVIGGLQIIGSAGDAAKRQEGVNKLIHTLLGLLLIIFSGVILHTINPAGYK